MKKLLTRHETYVFLVIIALCVIITSITPRFFTLENLFDLLRSYSFMGIFAIGVLFVLISGGIDISFTAVATVAAYTMTVVSIKYGGNMLTAFLIAAVVGTALGMLNAAIIYFFNIPSIITTIATLNIYYGILTVVSGGKWIYSLPTWFREFGEIKVFTLTSGEGLSYGLSLVTVIWFAIVILAWVILRYTIVGRGIYAMGGNLTSAQRAGFNIFFLQMFVYSFMGLLAGIAGVIQVLLVQTMAPNSMVGKELDVLAAVVLGGASLAGGTGTLTGTLLGVALIAIMSNGMTMMRIPSFWYNVFIGLTIIASVSLSAYRRRREKRRAIAVEVE
ncbi:MAG: ABC transporter permease [Anaerolineae bacterium]|nr:ABC transporter permease [Anaerolineae bacterium]